MIVVAENEDEAIKEAEKGYNKLIDLDNGGWDWFTIFNTPKDNTGIYATSRWGKVSSPLKFKSPESWEVLSSCYEYMGKKFMRSIDEIRVLLNTHTNIQVYEEIYPIDKEEKDCQCNTTRCKLATFMNLVSQCDLEHDYGENILFGLDKWDEDEYEVENLFNKKQVMSFISDKDQEKLWIVLADMHR